MPTGIYKRIKIYHPTEEVKEKIRATLTGRKLPLKHRLNIGKGNKGYVRPDEQRLAIKDRMKGNKNNLGHKHSAETRRKMRESSRKGEESPFWKGGITPENKKVRHSLEYRLWRTAVFERDNYTCVWCRVRGGKLNADHIKRFSQYPELRFAIDNGRTLCEPCHKTTETYGNKRT
jgi:hypothetical protein